jgi:superoxide dismutase
MRKPGTGNEEAAKSSSDPSFKVPPLALKITQTFGSLDDFVAGFSTAALKHFASGW